MAECNVADLLLCAERIIEAESKYRELARCEPVTYHFDEIGRTTKGKRAELFGELERLKDQCQQAAYLFRGKLAFADISRSLNGLRDALQQLQAWGQLDRGAADVFGQIHSNPRRFDERLAIARKAIEAMNSPVFIEFDFLCRHPVRAAVIKHPTPPDSKDGPIPPDGFRLNGIVIFGLAEDWQKVLTFVWERSGDPPKWQDVATHLGVFAQMNDVAFRKLIYKINKRTKDDWPETLQTVRGRVVLRLPVRGRTKSPGTKAKTRAANKSSRKTKRSTVSKKVGTKQTTRNKRATRK